MPKRLLICVVIATVMVGSPGCSLLISGYGIAWGVPETRDDVRRTFGRPHEISSTTLVNETTRDTREFQVEHYHVHAKFSPRYGPGYYPPLMLLFEPITMSMVLYEAAKEVSEGHILEFIYDDAGNTIGHRYPLSMMGTPRSPDHRSYTGDWTEISDVETTETPPDTGS